MKNKIFIFMANYNRIQFISYEINTSFNPIPDQQNRPNPIIPYAYYKGSLDPVKDLQNRCFLMCEAIETVYLSNSFDRSYDCLKLFIAPEFYFRSAFGAYRPEHTEEISKILRGFVSDNRFKDWLFVFGTIVEYIDSSINTESNCYKVRNFAFVHKGGYQTQDEAKNLSCIVLKENFSESDFQKSPNYAPINDKKKPLACFYENVIPFTQGCGIFKMDNISFGLEICSDHSMGRLSTALSNNGQNYVNIHLIISCGLMEFDKSFIEACHNGYFFLCDGFFTSFATKISKQSNEIEVQRIEIFNEIALHNSGTPLILYQRHFNPPVNRKYKTPNVCIYKPMPLPSSAGKNQMISKIL